MCNWPIPKKYHPCGHDVPDYTTVTWCDEKMDLRFDQRRFGHTLDGQCYTKYDVFMCPNPNTMEWKLDEICEKCRIEAIVAADLKKYEELRHREHQKVRHREHERRQRTADQKRYEETRQRRYEEARHREHEKARHLEHERRHRTAAQNRYEEARQRRYEEARQREYERQQWAAGRRW
nr:reticulocyte-binding protein 2 like a [Quercus suber]